MSKSSFTDGDISVLNYESVFAESIAINSIKRLIPKSVSLASTKRYLFTKDNILIALAKFIGNKRDIIIIGVNIGYQLKQILRKCNFNDRIKYIPSTERNSHDVLFVMKEIYLPLIEHKEIDEEEREELHLDPINEEYKIYASVIDINKESNKEIGYGWNIENDNDDLDLKVQLSISFLSVIYWKDNREIVQINIASEFEEQGIQNDINDIQPLQ